MKLQMHIDGGSRGNPGPSAGGVVLADERGAPVLEAGYFFGVHTNNEAEYTALLRGLDAAVARGVTELTIYSDSELLVRQINGDYRVKSQHLAPLFNSARAKLDSVSRWKIQHVMREQNQRADELANLAMDARRDVVELETGSASPPSRADTPSSAVEACATCMKTPARGACPAGSKSGDRLVFNATVPKGLCIEPAEAILRAVRAVRDGGKPTGEVTCPKPGCGAAFSINPC